MWEFVYMEEIMENLGVPASVVINMLYKQIILTKSIPFTLSLVKRPMTIEEMGKDEFDKMMALGYSEAIVGKCEDVDKI